MYRVMTVQHPAATEARCVRVLLDFGHAPAKYRQQRRPSQGCNNTVILGHSLHVPLNDRTSSERAGEENVQRLLPTPARTSTVMESITHVDVCMIGRREHAHQMPGPPSGKPICMSLKMHVTLT